MNILFLSRWFPFPPDNGSKIRIHHLLNGLSESHSVTLLSFSDSPATLPEQLVKDRVCSEVRVVPWKSYDERSLKARLGFFSPLPRSILDTYSYQMEGLIRETLLRKKYDLVVASQSSMASYYPCFKGVPALFEEIELGIFYDQANKAGNLVRRLRLNLTWFKLRRYFSRLLEFFEAGTVASEQERRLFADYFPKFREKIEVIPNCINMEDYTDLNVTPKSNHLIFSGSFTYEANYEAMQWFVGKVYPRILEQIPDAHLLITGDHANRVLPSMKNITLTGYVDDIKSLIASCSVSIAPLLSGGGTRLKILEAMALGTPVVATSKGAEGLGAQSGRDLLIADAPDAFAECVVKILRNGDLHCHLAGNASHFIKRNYDRSVVMPRFMKLIDRVAARRV
jgi:glycosyltransferase involved in cell wall biosynthesis